MKQGAARRARWRRLFEDAVVPWRVSHALGPLKALSFRTQVKPVLKAACKSHVKSEGSHKRRGRRFKRYLSRIACDLPDALCLRIAQDCWSDLDQRGSRSAL